MLTTASLRTHGRRTVRPVLFLLPLLAGSALAQGLETRVAMITPVQAGMEGISDGFGCGVFTIDKCNNTVSYYIVFQGLTGVETVSHIHGFAPAGVGAGVVHPLPLGNPKIGVWNYSEAQEADILAGRTYVNIHSTAAPGGEIRGQIVSHVADIDGAQENPAVTTAARGWGVFTIDTLSNTLSYHIEFAGLSAAETAAHIHGFAAHGTNAGVVHPLPPGSPKIGVWNYPESAERAILDGMTYVNIHSSAHPGGEIRGQVVPIVAPIDATQENPSTGVPSAAGCGLFSIDRANDQLGYDIRAGGLSAAESAAHIHGFAPRGTNAGVVHPMTVGPRKLGVWSYPGARENAILRGRTYVNVHTGAHPGGEMRGQIEFPVTACIADLDGDGVISLPDLAILLSNFGLGSGAQYCDGDFDGDGDVDLTDLSVQLSRFGSACP